MAALDAFLKGFSENIDFGAFGSPSSQQLLEVHKIKAKRKQAEALAVSKKKQDNLTVVKAIGNIMGKPPGTRIELLKMLFASVGDDVNPQVKQAALAMMNKVEGDDSLALMQALVDNPNIPIQQMIKLLGDPVAFSKLTNKTADRKRAAALSKKVGAVQEETKGDPAAMRTRAAELRAAGEGAAADKLEKIAKEQDERGKAEFEREIASEKLGLLKKTSRREEMAAPGKLESQRIDNIKASLEIADNAFKSRLAEIKWLEERGRSANEEDRKAIRFQSDELIRQSTIEKAEVDLQKARLDLATAGGTTLGKHIMLSRMMQLNPGATPDERAKAYRGLLATLGKMEKDARAKDPSAPTSKVVTVRIPGENGAADTFVVGRATGGVLEVLEKIDDQGKAIYRLADVDEVMTTRTQVETIEGLPKAEMTKRHADTRLTKQAFSALARSFRNIGRSEGIDFGVVGFGKLVVNVLSAPWTASPMFGKFASLKANMKAIHGQLTSVLDANQDRFTKDEREVLVKILPLAGDFFENRRGALIKMGAVMAILADRLSQVIGGTNISAKDIRSSDIYQLRKAGILNEGETNDILNGIFGPGNIPDPSTETVR